MPEQQPFADVQIDTGNVEPRVPCVLVLDTSGSMETDGRIELLNEGVDICKRELAGDSLSAKRVEIAVVTFGGTANLLSDFATVDQFQPPRLKADGETPMGAAINLAVDLVTQRKQVYKQNGLGYYRPWIFLITDGAATDQETLRAASLRVQEGERQNAFVFYSVGVEGADFGELKRISRRTEPLKLKGLSFRELFTWLSSSLSSVSKSTPGDAVPLADPTAGPQGWGVVPGAQ